MNLSGAIVGVVKKGEKSFVFARDILTITIASSTKFSEQGEKAHEEKPQSEQCGVQQAIYLCKEISCQ